MIIIWGQKLYGRVDRVPGFFYVATKFFHAWYIPVIPLGSWVVLEGTESDDGWRGASLGFNLKSVLFGWLRGACWVIALGALLVSLTAYGEQRPAWWRPLIPAVTAITFFFFTKLFEKASAERAFELAETLEFTPELMQALEAKLNNADSAMASEVESGVEPSAEY